jgi:hypothetical protein
MKKRCIKKTREYRLGFVDGFALGISTGVLLMAIAAIIQQ